MPQNLTIQEIEEYINIVKAQGVGSAIDIYNILYDKGYNYAGWAVGVASGNTITGQSAMDYLKGSAMMGLGSDACRNLTDSDMDSIRIGMSLGYLETLYEIAAENNGMVSRDINYSEVRDFHETVFVNNGLGIVNWTLAGW